ncbi:hypothetical protein KOI35_26730 [Actinoplanes bogorensis]|uniref:Uncharacterized protein n=1 Tax=Paractinoplanes bogorensis TaxID=1610840 RepID=A0ABS5YUH5_9ACTN|nr:hypothetical protein [Actinoplanes bogorensis]MBU2667108.1 hypothetical protein [Actinoplanes bogorensis]
MARTTLALAAACAVASVAPAVPVAAAPASTAATAIVLERTGGFAGRSDTFVVDRSTVGGRTPLRAAGSAEFRSLRRSYQLRNNCCDRYTYRITVSYRHGRSKTVDTVQGAPAPRILGYVIDEVQRVGRQTPEGLTRKSAERLRVAG